METYSAAQSEKFVQEVFWRSYFKGGLEHNPHIWPSDYIAARFGQNLV